MHHHTTLLNITQTKVSFPTTIHANFQQKIELTYDMSYGALKHKMVRYSTYSDIQRLLLY